LGLAIALDRGSPEDTMKYAASPPMHTLIQLCRVSNPTPFAMLYTRYAINASLK